MDLVNATRMLAGYTLATESSGRELLVVVIKGTFRIPQDGAAVRLDETQLPFVMADTFTGAPGLSAPVYEADFAARKLQCDVLLLGSAYAPGGRPALRVPVGLRVGNVMKRFTVVGDRQWRYGGAGIGSTAPQAFVSKTISYDLAFGGAGREHSGPGRNAAFLPNPAGRGFCHEPRVEWVEGTPLPNTEELDRPVLRPDEAYRPMAFGPVGRGWDPRCRYAGTYDGQWLEHQFPFLPVDFDERYFQAAPPDQQLPLPTGLVEVGLVNLTPDGQRSFAIPHFDAPILVFPKHGEREEHRARLDTIVLEPDAGRFTMTWRMTRTLRNNIFEIAQVLIGRPGREWWQQREQLAFPIPVVTIPAGHEPAVAEG